MFVYFSLSARTKIVSVVFLVFFSQATLELNKLVGEITKGADVARADGNKDFRKLEDDRSQNVSKVMEG